MPMSEAEMVTSETKIAACMRLVVFNIVKQSLFSTQ